MTTKHLTPKQARFAEEYLIDENSKQAAIRCGYSEKGAKNAGYRLLHSTAVAELIKKLRTERLEKLGVTSDRVLREWALIAFSNLQDIVYEDENGNSQVNLKNLPRHVASALAEINIETSNGKTTVKKTKIRLHDKMNALDKLSKHLGIAKEQVDHNVNLSLEDLVTASYNIKDKKPEVIEGKFTEAEALGGS